MRAFVATRAYANCLANISLGATGKPTCLRGVSRADRRQDRFLSPKCLPVPPRKLRFGWRFATTKLFICGLLHRYLRTAKPMAPQSSSCCCPGAVVAGRDLAIKQLWVFFRLLSTLSLTWVELGGSQQKCVFGFPKCQKPGPPIGSTINLRGLNTQVVMCGVPAPP